MTYLGPNTRMPLINWAVGDVTFSEIVWTLIDVTKIIKNFFSFVFAHNSAFLVPIATS